MQIEVISESITPEQEELKTDVKSVLKSAAVFPVIAITAGILFYVIFGLASKREPMSETYRRF